jgi:hypothetical protein
MEERSPLMPALLGSDSELNEDWFADTAMMFQDHVDDFTAGLMAHEPDQFMARLLQDEASEQTGSLSPHSNTPALSAAAAAAGGDGAGLAAPPAGCLNFYYKSNNSNSNSNNSDNSSNSISNSRNSSPSQLAGTTSAIDGLWGNAFVGAGPFQGTPAGPCMQHFTAAVAGTATAEFLQAPNLLPQYAQLAPAAGMQHFPGVSHHHQQQHQQQQMAAGPGAYTGQHGLHGIPAAAAAGEGPTYLSMAGMMAPSQPGLETLLPAAGLLPGSTPSNQVGTSTTDLQRHSSVNSGSINSSGSFMAPAQAYSVHEHPLPGVAPLHPNQGAAPPLNPWLNQDGALLPQALVAAHGPLPHSLHCGVFSAQGVTAPPAVQPMLQGTAGSMGHGTDGTMMLGTGNMPQGTGGSMGQGTGGSMGQGTGGSMGQGTGGHLMMGTAGNMMMGAADSMGQDTAGNMVMGAAGLSQPMHNPGFQHSMPQQGLPLLLGPQQQQQQVNGFSD